MTRALRSGVAAWLSSDIGPVELALAVRAVRAGFMVVGGDAQHIVRASFKNGASRESDPQASTTLTARQQQVMELLAEGLMNKEIASQLNISRRTVEMHVSHLMAKLGARSRPQLLVRLARELPPVVEGTDRRDPQVPRRS